MGGRSGEEPSNHLWTVYKYTSPKSATESCVCVCVFVMLQWRPTYRHNMSKDRPSAFAQWLWGTVGVAPRGNRGMGQVSPSGVCCGIGTGSADGGPTHKIAARGGDRPAASFHQGWSAMIQQPFPLGSLYPGPGVSGRCTQLTRGCADARAGMFWDTSAWSAHS